MGRRAQGWKLRLRGGTYFVRFALGGATVERSTKSGDPGEAAKTAAQIYAEFVSGRQALTRGRGPTLATEQAITDWLLAFSADHDVTTVATYEIYATAHWLPRFPTLGHLTAASVADYARARLRKVTRSTVRKELSALRGFLG